MDDIDFARDFMVRASGRHGKFAGENDCCYVVGVTEGNARWKRSSGQ